MQHHWSAYACVRQADGVRPVPEVHRSSPSDKSCRRMQPRLRREVQDDLPKTLQGRDKVPSGTKTHIYSLPEYWVLREVAKDMRVKFSLFSQHQVNLIRFVVLP